MAPFLSHRQQIVGKYFPLAVTNDTGGQSCYDDAPRRGDVPFPATIFPVPGPPANVVHGDYQGMAVEHNRYGRLGF